MVKCLVFTKLNSFAVGCAIAALTINSITHLSRVRHMLKCSVLTKINSFTVGHATAELTINDTCLSQACHMFITGSNVQS